MTRRNPFQECQDGSTLEELLRTVYNSHDMEATWMPISRQMDKEAVVHIHHGILRSH